MWDCTDDLDLYVKTPSGEEICYCHKESRCGGKLDVDMNAGGTKSSKPVENVFWRDAPDGGYKIWARNVNRSDRPYTIRIKQKGECMFIRGRTSGGTGPVIDFQHPDPQLKSCPITRLTTSVSCVKEIIRNNIEITDTVGLVSFATDVKWEFPLEEKGDNEAQLIDAVGKLKTRGKTAFYSAVNEACEKLVQHGKSVEGQKWVVALTDGADTNSAPSHLNEAVTVIQGSDINLAVITLGNEVDRGKVSRLIEATKQGAEPSEGMHISANDLDAVRQAFASIADTIAESSKGAVG